MPEDRIEPNMTLDAGDVLGWPPEHREAVKAWLAEAVGERTMRDTYEVELVAEGRITVRYFVRDVNGLRSPLVRASVTIDWPIPPPEWTGA